VLFFPSACGAVREAIAGAELGNLAGLLATIRPAVAAARYEGLRKASNHGFVDAVARTKVRLMIGRTRAGSPILHAREDDRTVRILGATRDIRTGAVDFQV
jgi:carbonic anhydrase